MQLVPLGHANVTQQQYIRLHVEQVCCLGDVLCQRQAMHLGKPLLAGGIPTDGCHAHPASAALSDCPGPAREGHTAGVPES